MQRKCAVFFYPDFTLFDGFVSSIFISRNSIAITRKCPQPFNTVTWYDLLLRGEQINEFAPMTETELRLKLQ